MRNIVLIHFLFISVLAFGQTITINGDSFYSSDLDHVLNSELENYEGDTVLVELSTDHFHADNTINIPSSWGSVFVLKGNHATVISTCRYYLFHKSADYTRGLHAIPDTYQEITDLYIRGGFGGIHIIGGFGSKISNVNTVTTKNGILVQFGLQTTIERCIIKSPKGFGIKLTSIGHSYSSAQCNVSVLRDNRVYCRKDPGTELVGIYIQDSNLVSLQGNIIEGHDIHTGIRYDNRGTTVEQFEISRVHFECAHYSNACIYLTGACHTVLIDQMFYNRVEGTAIRSDMRAYSRIYLQNIGRTINWQLETNPPRPGRKKSTDTAWYFHNVKCSNVRKLFSNNQPQFIYSTQLIRIKS